MNETLKKKIESRIFIIRDQKVMMDSDLAEIYEVTSKRLNEQVRCYLPYVFTEHGASMLGNVLNSAVAVNTSIQVVRAFAHLRKMLASHSELSKKLDQLEKKYDHQFKVVFDAIRQITIQPEVPKKESASNKKIHNFFTIHR